MAIFCSSQHHRSGSSTLWEIKRIARRAESKGGLACRDAMLFDGGHSTQIYVAGDLQTIRVDGDPVPVFVFAKRK